MAGRWKGRALLVAAAALLGLTAASAAGAQPAATSSSSAALAGTLNIYGFGPGDDVANGRAEFATRSLGSGVTVNNPRGGFNDQAFLAMLASRNVPDVVYLSRASVGTYAAKRAFVPLTSCIRSERIDLKQYRAAALREVTYKGQVYALPEFTNQITLIVNNEVARQAGVNPADIQTTNWRKLRAANKKMLRIEDGKVTRIGFDPKIPEFFPLWVKWFGADIVSKDGLTPRLNSREAVAALEFTHSLIRDHGGWDRFKAFRDTWDFFGRQNQVARNQVGAWPMESWYYNVMADNSPGVDITAKFFTNRRGGPITFFQGNGWAIPRGAKNPGLACKWMKAMTSVDAWMTVAKNRFDLRKRQGREFTGLYTANARADVKIYQDIFQPMGRKQFDEAVVKLVQASKYGFAVPVSPAGAEIKQAYIDAINRVLAGQQTPRASLNQAQREAVAAIRRNR
ncbi:MAG TPA: extracellular solute-binding protein [Gaiellaceae bacterium]|jgi:multiple sugar transport system substrate-binding protein|nr:extracellular solute-binding protein [Gaiellaceae bacterium]